MIRISGFVLIALAVLATKAWRLSEPYRFDYEDDPLSDLFEYADNSGRIVSAYHAIVGHVTRIDLDISNIDLPGDIRKLSVILLGPRGTFKYLEFNGNQNGELTVEFTPRVTGAYKIFVKKRGQQVEGSPFTVMVERESKATTVGSNNQMSFAVPGMSERQFRSTIGYLTRPGSKSPEPIELRYLAGGNIGAIFTKEVPGLYIVKITQHKRDVIGSPFNVLIPRKGKQPMVGISGDLPLGIHYRNVINLKGVLERPDGEEAQLKVKLGPLNMLYVTFTPLEPGLHKISIINKESGKDITKSPILVIAGERKKVIFHPKFQIPGIKAATFRYLKGTITSPSKVTKPIPLTLRPFNTIAISFTPKEAGSYIVTIKKHGEHIGDSPYTVIVRPEDIAK